MWLKCFSVPLILTAKRRLTSKFLNLETVHYTGGYKVMAIPNFVSVLHQFLDHVLRRLHVYGKTSSVFFFLQKFQRKGEMTVLFKIKDRGSWQPYCDNCK